MAARVTGAEVKEILSTTLTAAQLTPFITAANLVVTQHLATLDHMTDELLKEIERWLAAHLASSALVRQATSKSIGGASESYSTAATSGKGYGSTTYGLQALALDFTGTLAELGKPGAAFEVALEAKSTWRD